MASNVRVDMKPNYLSLARLALIALWPIEAWPADYVVNGWKINVSVARDSPSIFLGEPTWLSFKVENLSEESLEIIVSDGDVVNMFRWWPGSFKIRVMDEKGGIISSSKKEGAGGFSYRVGPRPLPVRSNYVFRLFVPEWTRFERAGVYTFVCEKQLQLLKPQPDHSWKNATNLDVSAKTELTVVPYDDARMGRLIHELGEKLLGASESSEARKALASIHDDRVLPIWLESQKRKTYDAKFHALSALGDYPAPESVEALKRAVDLKGPDLPDCCTTAEGAESLAKNIRVVAVHSLSKNKNPAARKFLLDHRRHADDELRLTVVHMLGREKSDEATSILKEMTVDTNKLVRGEAERYLKERGAARPAF